MRPILQPIFARRSVRSYLDIPISDESVRDLLEAAMAAPSAMAKDPWRFIVVRDQQMRDAIADGLSHGQMLRHAPVGVLICGDLEAAHGNFLSYMLQDCSAAIENLLLAASMMGLGACWLGAHPREDRVAHLRSIFGLPENIIPISVISIGVPAETPEARTRYDETRVHWDKW